VISFNARYFSLENQTTLAHENNTFETYLDAENFSDNIPVNQRRNEDQKKTENHRKTDVKM